MVTKSASKPGFYGVSALSYGERAASHPKGGCEFAAFGLFLTPDRVRPKTEKEIEGERLAAENERSARLRWVYEAIGLAVSAHKDGTLLRWSCGTQTLPVVTGFERPVTPSKEWGFSAWLPPVGAARIEVGTDYGGTAR